jgi:hypothetical protein
MASGVDPAFPYANTGVGVDGYSIPEVAFKSRAKFKDVMGYCYPTWISDYTWNAFAARIRITTAFSSTSPLLTKVPQRSVQGFQTRGRRPQWGIVDGPLVSVDEPIAGARWARIFGADGRSTRVPVDLLRSPAGPEPDARVVAFNVPDGPIAHVEVHVDGARWLIAAADLE